MIDRDAKNINLFLKNKQTITNYFNFFLNVLKINCYFNFYKLFNYQLVFRSMILRIWSIFMAEWSKATTQHGLG